MQVRRSEREDYCLPLPTLEIPYIPYITLPPNCDNKRQPRSFDSINLIPLYDRHTDYTDIENAPLISYFICFLPR